MAGKAPIYTVWQPKRSGWKDDWHYNYEGAPNDGRAWVDEPRDFGRVIRGGGWSSGALGCVSAIRRNGPDVGRFSYLGFRLARSVVPGP